MQKTWLIGILLVLTLTGCQSERQGEHALPPTVTPPVAQVDLNTPVDKDVVSEDLINNFKYLDQNISKMSTEEATANFFKLEEMSIKKQFYYVEVISLDNHIQTELMKCFNAEKGEFDFGKYDGGSGMVIDEIYASGYKLVPYEGVVYPVTDYSKFKPYAAFMSEEVQSYIYLKSLESEEYTGTRSSLEISQADLVERILLAENHLRHFKGGKTYPIVLEMYKAYMYYYIPSAIIFEDKLQINDEMIASYESFIDAYPETISAQIVSDYLNMLKENGYEKTEAVNTYLQAFYNSIDHFITRAE